MHYNIKLFRRKYKFNITNLKYIKQINFYFISNHDTLI